MTKINIQTLNIHIAQRANPISFGVLGSLITEAIGETAANRVTSEERFVLHSSGDIVIDNKTGLWWPVEESSTQMDHDDATNYCSEFSLGGFNDWTMPTRGQQDGILVFEEEEPMLSPLFKTNGEYVWTSTETPWSRKEKRTGSSRSFFVVNLYHGLVNYNYASSRFRVRPVRVGGAARPGQ